MTKSVNQIVRPFWNGDENNINFMVRLVAPIGVLYAKYGSSQDFCLGRGVFKLWYHYISQNKLLHTCRFVHGSSWVCAQFKLDSTTLDEEDWNTTPIHEGMLIQTTRVLLGGNLMSIRVGLKAKRVNFIGSVKILSNLFEKPLNLIKRWQYWWNLTGISWRTAKKPLYWWRMMKFNSRD